MIGSFAGITALNFLENVNEDNIRTYRNIYRKINTRKNQEALAYIELEFRKIKEILDSITDFRGVTVRTNLKVNNRPLIVKFEKDSLALTLVQLFYYKKEYIDKLFEGMSLEDSTTVDRNNYPFLNSTNYTTNGLLQVGYNSFRSKLDNSLNKYYSDIRSERESNQEIISLTDYLITARDCFNNYKTYLEEIGSTPIRDIVMSTETSKESIEEQCNKYNIMLSDKTKFNHIGSNIKMEASIRMNDELGLAGYHHNLKEMFEKSKDILNMEESFDMNKVTQTLPSAIKLLDILIDSTEGLGEDL